MKSEPVVTRAVVGLIVSAAAHYGLDLTADALMGVVGVVTGIVTFFQRRKVSPTDD